MKNMHVNNKFFFLPGILLITHLSVLAQSADNKSPQETARAFTRQGDYTNAIVVLNSALKNDPKNLELLKDLAFNYYLNKDYAKGEEIAKPLVEREDADVMAYQELAMFYKANGELKDCERLYKEGLKRWPRSGVLYSEYGELMGTKEDYLAIKQWEKGIETDPNYSGNYYNAAKYYFYRNNIIWALIYGEVFINLESYSKRTAEMKQILLEGYKKIFTDQDQLKSQTGFAGAWANVISPLSTLVKNGITAESLTVLRTRFIINWFNTYPSNYPFRLFDYQRQLLKDGMFDAYNEWIFGAAGNLPVFQAWTNTHSDDYNRFINYQRGRIFKIPEGQYYQAATK
jgi:tetratricopeptide (TPR) repeat protein